jgi:GxxExxY protein
MLRARAVASGIRFERQKAIPLVYKGLTLDGCYRIDLIVEATVVVEIKAVEQIHPVFEAQLITYLRVTGCPVGVLINFNVPKLTNGIMRRANIRPRP